MPIPNYYPYYPQNYNPQQNYMMNNQQIPQQQIQPQQQQIQNAGFISVRGENDVFNYPVGPGNCMTFKIEGQPIVFEKSMGFSQLEAPKVKKYRLVEEEALAEHGNEQEIDNTAIEKLENEIKALWGEVNALKEQTTKKSTTRKKEDGDV